VSHECRDRRSGPSYVRQRKNRAPVHTSQKQEGGVVSLGCGATQKSRVEARTDREQNERKDEQENLDASSEQLRGNGAGKWGMRSSKTNRGKYRKAQGEKDGRYGDVNLVWEECDAKTEHRAATVDSHA